MSYSAAGKLVACLGFNVIVSSEKKYFILLSLFESFFFTIRWGIGFQKTETQGKILWISYYNFHKYSSENLLY